MINFIEVLEINNLFITRSHEYLYYFVFQGYGPLQLTVALDLLLVLVSL